MVKNRKKLRKRGRPKSFMVKVSFTGQQMELLLRRFGLTEIRRLMREGAYQRLIHEVMKGK